MTRTPYKREELEDLFVMLGHYAVEHPKAITVPLSKVELFRLAATIDKLMGIKNGA